MSPLLGPIAAVENPPRMEGRFLSMILVPNREAIEAERKAAQKAEASVAEIDAKPAAIAESTEAPPAEAAAEGE